MARHLAAQSWLRCDVCSDESRRRGRRRTGRLEACPTSMKPRFLLLMCMCGIAVRSPAAESYTFTTIAGLAGVSGNADGTNSDARFLFPADIAVDNNGVLYVADLSNHAIRKIVPVGTNWVVTTIAGMAGVL